MSWYYLRGQAVESWGESSLAGAPSALLKLMPTAEASCLRGKKTVYYPRSPYGMTLRRLTDGHGADTLMWYRGDSRVRTYLRPGGARESAGKEADCGPSSPESLAKYNPALYSWKTAQYSLLGGLTEFSGTWPRWGMMRDGECWALTTREPRTGARESGFWPTPTVSDSWFVGISRETARRNIDGGGRGKTQLAAVAKYRGGAGGLNPEWVAWLMGWPIGWTGLAPLVTDRFQRWLDWFGGY